MSQTVTLKQSEYKKLIERISALEKAVQSLIKRLQKEPSYGSDAWWEWSDTKAIDDIKKGNYVAFDSAQEMVEYLERQ